MTEDPSTPRRPEGTPKPQRTGYPQMRPAQGYQVPGRAAAKRIPSQSGQPHSQVTPSSGRPAQPRTTQLGASGSGDNTRIITFAQSTSQPAGLVPRSVQGDQSRRDQSQRASSTATTAAFSQPTFSPTGPGNGERRNGAAGTAGAVGPANTANAQRVRTGQPAASQNAAANQQVYSPSEAWANRPADNSPSAASSFEARDYNAAPVPDPTYGVDDDKSKKKKRSSRKLGAAGVIGVTLVTILVLIIVGFGSYVLGNRAGHAEGYQRGYSEGSNTVARSADDALQKLNSVSSSSSSVSSSLAAMLPLVNPCSEKYGQREAAQTTWGRYGWGCKFTSEKGRKFSVLIGEADRDTVGKPRIEKRRNGQTKGCIATGSPQAHPAFGLTVWVAEDKGLDSCKMAKDKWNEVAKSS